MQRQNEREIMNFQSQLKQVNKELEIASKENSSLKSYIDQLIDENTKLKLDIKNSRVEIEHEPKKTDKSTTDESLKKTFLEAVQKMSEAQYRIKHLEETIEDLTNGKTLAEGEQCTLRYQISDYKSKINEQNATIKDLEKEINGLKNDIREMNEVIKEFKQNPNNENYEELERNLLTTQQTLMALEKDRNEMVQKMVELKCELHQSKDEVTRLTKELVNETEKNVRRNLEKELYTTEYALNKHEEIKSEECKY